MGRVILVPESESYWWAIRPLYSRRECLFPKTDPHLHTLPRNWTHHTNKKVIIIHLAYPKSVYNRQNFRCASCMMVLTVCQKAEQHFHLRQGAEAGEVRPLRATGPGGLLPTSCFWQHPVAETIMRPPAVSTLCVDILPVLCKMKKSRERRNQNTTVQNTFLQPGFTADIVLV